MTVNPEAIEQEDRPAPPPPPPPPPRAKKLPREDDFYARCIADLQRQGYLLMRRKDGAWTWYLAKAPATQKFYDFDAMPSDRLLTAEFPLRNGRQKTVALPAFMVTNSCPRKCADTLYSYHRLAT